MSPRILTRLSWTPERRLAHYTRRDPISGCLIWQGKPTKHGYGRLKVGPKGMEYAHRFAWTVRNGPIPKGMLLCHRCDERRCVNPDHLFLGSYALNNADRKAKRAAMTLPLAAPTPTGDDNASIRIVYRGLEMVGTVAIRPLLGLGAGIGDRDQGEG